ncbi:MAG: type I-F CRISPR-associated helicase Cas3f [Chlamydiales bacterium]|nr:type I-F CRISPR-associated helicase Cas3f [Chlamydiales bacterium]
MKILLVSQCSKNALGETRRIIDQFAERKGDNIWETNITEHGLQTVKKLLKATARKNTAVACHLLRGRLQSELLWIVGSLKKFNSEGTVPTNSTSRNILRANDEDDWHTGESIAVLSSIAGLFHDFGKAGKLFQQKLSGKRDKSYEPYRHEWISLYLFKLFVGESSDREWLERLSRITLKDEKLILKKLPKGLQLRENPLQGLPPLAKFIGWLILSHHRLPVHRQDEAPDLFRISNWMDSKVLTASWNSPYYDSSNCEPDLKHVGTFPEGTPFRSKTWCYWAKRAAQRALKNYEYLERDWFQDRFSMHLMRAALMLSDHHYSAGSPHANLQDSGYDAYANTHYENGERTLKQKLDEHNIGVARGAFFISKSLPKLREHLPSIARHKAFKSRTKDARFSWQDKAYDLAYSVRRASDERGFFGVNLASTGCGKTLGNARIMYGLSDEAKGCRFSIALGLRVLTLQTGDALREKLFLKDDDLAVMIGSRAFQRLYELKNDKTSDTAFGGSESIADLVDEEHYVHYEGSLDDGRLSTWLRSSHKLNKLVSAPILVSTIDHLITATEGCRGGKQIAPILRLLTSDLVLDEPDDFDVADLPALCRLVNFAGVFGSRVLLSSATLPPSIVKALFDAYVTGRRAFNGARRRVDTEPKICCAWFDEFEVASSDHEDSDSFMSSHCDFIDNRVARLKQQTVLRRASLIPVISKPTAEDAERAYADTIHSMIYDLHDQHHQVHPATDQKVSIGLVRMANINPMVSVMQKLLSQEVRSNYRIHFCCYHSRFPLLIRSKIEEVLDNVLGRHDPSRLWKIPEIDLPLKASPEVNHIFVVFATSVAEVGRDHDYDWAIVEPSSMRSIIQLAGRVQRHRRMSVSEPNLAILQKNIRALQGDEQAYCMPGFESKAYQLSNKDLSVSLLDSQYKEITAVPRLRVSESSNRSANLVDLEHARLDSVLVGDSRGKLCASMWWKHNPDWCAVVQDLSRFRGRKCKEEEFIYCYSEDWDGPKLCAFNGLDDPQLAESAFNKERFVPATGFNVWINCDVATEIESLATRLAEDVHNVSRGFTWIRLRELKDGNRWYFDPVFGFYEK